MKWAIQKISYRCVHHFMKVVAAFTPLPTPKLFTGPGVVGKIPAIIKQSDIDNVLVVTDAGLMELGLVNGLLDELKSAGINYTVFADVEPNPTIQVVEAGLEVYNANNCQGIIIFGGGSPMDCAKIIAARSARPGKQIREMRGMFRIRRLLPPLFAVPTTAGTGSEVSMGAVITDSESHEKFAIIDMSLVPKYAFLDSELTRGLPPMITATTGMDALTHAVEAYIGLNDTQLVKNYAEKSTRLIFENIEKAYQDGTDLEAREAMAVAAAYAGAALTRANMGYVHAIAHSIGGLYGVPHGLANSIILPYVLDVSRSSCEAKLARLAIEVGLGHLGEDDRELSIRFIDRLKEMNRNMNIPTVIEELKAEDIPLIAERAFNEGNPIYPVPLILDRKGLEALIRKMLP